MTGIKRQMVIIQERDRRLLSELATLGVVDREQAKVAGGFGSTTRVNTRLLKLTRAGYLRRTFYGTIAGGRRAIYALAPQGAALAGVELSKSITGQSAFEHQLAINEVYLALKHRESPYPGVRLERWRIFSKRLSASAPIIPDAYFEIDTPSGVQPMFLEVDLGTETLSVFQKKIRAYFNLALSGEFERSSGHPRFRVLCVANGSKRLQSLRAKTLKVTPKIFWFAELKAITEHGLFSPLWLRPEGTQRLPLL